MTFDDARAAIVGRLKATLDASNPTTAVSYENRATVDLATQAAPFVACEVLFNDGEQASMELAPVVRYSGAIWLAVAVKEGEGTKTALVILGTLAAAFKTVSFGGVVAQAPRPMPGFRRDGWYYEPIRVPFYFDDIPA